MAATVFYGLAAAYAVTHWKSRHLARSAILAAAIITKVVVDPAVAAAVITIEPSARKKLPKKLGCFPNLNLNTLKRRERIK